MNEAARRSGLETSARFLLALALIVLSPVAANAGDGGGRFAVSRSAARSTPAASESPPRGVSPKIRAARSLAFSRLRHSAKCRALFEAEEADGVLLLERATFRRATAIERTEICRRRRAALFTTLRGAEIGVCPKEFGMLRSSHRAALLLHEALHHAGVSEQPFDPQALSSIELTRLVERRCSL